LATEAAKQLTHALLNPQQAGPFTQVGNDQIIALERLSAIFKGALPKHMRSPSPPPAESDNSDIRPRVQITVSHPRVQTEATPPMVVLPTTTNIIVPNSHRRLQQTPCGAVTPYTPHPMVRRSAAPQNSSYDMLADTVKRENHMLLLPTGPAIKQSKSAIKNKPVIIMPEIAKAVIFPDTGKSLKHQ
jgi:hypothetical protein